MSATEIKQEPKLIYELKPSNFDSFVKVLSLFEKETQLSIYDSVICHQIGNSIVKIDFFEQVQEKLNLEFANLRNAIKTLKTIRGKNDVKIYDATSQYVFTNDMFKIFIPKPSKSEDNIENSLPDLEGMTNKYFAEIDNENIKNIIAAEGNVVNYIVHDDKLKGLKFENIVYTFNDYTSDPFMKNAHRPGEDDDTLLLTTKNFLPIPSDKYEIYINQLSDGSWYSITKCDKTRNKIDVYESLEVSKMNDGVLEGALG